jgi:predicted DsbA family dithiol-disulfide isomerase
VVSVVWNCTRGDEERSMTTIEVFADVCCPFSHVGLRRLVSYRDAHGADVRFRVRAWPLELVNGEPLGAAMVAEEIEALREQVAPDLFRGFDPENFPSTSLPAFELVAAAYRRDVSAGEEASLLVRDALFEEGRDIADPEELRRLAYLLDVPADDAMAGSARADWMEGRRRGVMGSPHFFVAGRSFFCPTLRIERVGGHLHVSRDEDSLAAFLDVAVPAA